MKRYDYRRDYKDMDIDTLKRVRETLRDRLAKTFGNDTATNYSKRLSYINSKIEKMSKS